MNAQYPRLAYLWPCLMILSMVSTIVLLISDAIGMSESMHSDGTFEVDLICYPFANYLVFHCLMNVVIMVSSCVWIRVGEGESYADLSVELFLPKIKNWFALLACILLLVCVVGQLGYSLYALSIIFLKSEGDICWELEPKLAHQVLLSAFVTIFSLFLPALFWMPVLFAEIRLFISRKLGNLIPVVERDLFKDLVFRLSWAVFPLVFL